MHSTSDHSFMHPKDILNIVLCIQHTFMTSIMNFMHIYGRNINIMISQLWLYLRFQRPFLKYIILSKDISEWGTLFSPICLSFSIIHCADISGCIIQTILINVSYIFLIIVLCIPYIFLIIVLCIPYIFLTSFMHSTHISDNSLMQFTDISDCSFMHSTDISDCSVKHFAEAL